MMRVVGLDSNTDIWVTFSTLGSFGEFANKYDEPLTKHVGNA